jgi:CDGSH-type Zn-finger protein
MTQAQAAVRVVVSKDGPYIVTGNVPLSIQTIIADSDGDSKAWKESEGLPQVNKYAFCRCGQSKKKPFCDGTHTEIGFDGTAIWGCRFKSESVGGFLSGCVAGVVGIRKDGETPCKNHY